MLNLNALYFDTVAAKVELAHQLYRQHGARLAADATVAGHLVTLARRSAWLAEQMRAMGLGTLCSSCAARADGGCCSAFMANETDAVLLLINLLEGRTVARLRPEEDPECCFLGPTGCTLDPKPIFCLNYNCRAILTMAPERVDALISAAGAVLRCQTELEQYLLDAIGFTRRQPGP